MYDVTGSYTVGFIILACIALVALSLMIAVYVIDRRSRNVMKTNIESCIVQCQPADTKC